MTVLDTVQRLQFTDRAAAEVMLLKFMRDELGLDAVSVELRPLAVSLNSFNGFMTLRNGERLFFKTHTEANTIITEYYNAANLASAGYPVLQPVYSSTTTGRQLLIYPVIESPSVFDVACAIENGDSADATGVQRAQEDTDDHLRQIYADTLTLQSGADAAAAPVHQLFHHRIAGGRLSRFYGAGQGSDETVALPGGDLITLKALRSLEWTVNGQRYAESLNDLIERGARLLTPDQSGASIIGHGDAHNGNLFYLSDGPSLLYFDPAFAGRHSPLLDLAKPLFHNVFAMWMYFPHEKAREFVLSARVEGGRMVVEHNYLLAEVRHMFLRSKAERVLTPTLRLMRETGLLQDDWRTYLKAALMCCPLLTMNLSDSARFPAEVQLLGFAMAVEMGAESEGERSLIDRTLDRASCALE
ncbi:MAG TPA: hypothetical protein VER79_11220 [Candidatus Limnocylindrales bacterium]|nr:hypothetical protein [Candidatus Limnocylindrales bacterium]